jgi:hypothetical protein
LVQEPASELLGGSPAWADPAEDSSAHADVGEVVESLRFAKASVTQSASLLIANVLERSFSCCRT